ncbi:hypothetical protein LDENG_00267870 [Lucifuga dentata]|nr:hypothetical protein LDENG_00267870 [Lucifuga dentata]
MMIILSHMHNTAADADVYVLVVLGLFYKVLVQDPGTLDRADVDPHFSCIADLVENNQSLLRFCPSCELFQPDCSKHCKLCEVCIKDYDHHCLFLNRCVGQGNHRLFLLFILSMVTAHLLFVATAASYLYGKMPANSQSLSLWLRMLGVEFWVLVMVIMNALTLFWEVWLLTEQFDTIASGTTSYFRHSAASARRRSLGRRWLTVLLFLLEGQRQVGRGQMRDDKPTINV